jgi:hypothetical protein
MLTLARSGMGVASVMGCPLKGAHGHRAAMGRGRALPGRNRVGHGHRDLPDAWGRDARASGRELTVPHPDRSAEDRMGRRERGFVGDRDEVRAEAHRQADLLESLGGEKGGAGPVGAFVHAEAGEREQRDQRDEADGEHGECGENLRERQSLLVHKEWPHAHRPRGKQ